MKQPTVENALSDYVKLLKQQEKLSEDYRAKIDKIEATKTKIEAYLTELPEPVLDIPSEIKDNEPFLAWKISQKSDEQLIYAHMQIDDVIIPAITRESDMVIAKLKEQKEELEKYALALMTQRKCSNFGVTGIGRVENRTSIKYNIADKKLFTNWAIEHQCVDELTISLRPNSKFMAQVVDEAGELPSGVSSFKEHKAVFVKS